MAPLPMPHQTARIREFVVQEALSAPDGHNTLYGVKILGTESSNNRIYPPDVIQRDLSLYEGVKVNINHLPPGSTGHRHLEDRFGKLINVRWDKDCPRADLLYNPAHAMAPTVEWWARNQPDCLGLSHDAIASGKTENNVFVVDRIVSVKSVDLVANPATTKGLYESEVDMSEQVVVVKPTVEDDAEKSGNYKDHLGDMVKSIMCDEELSKDEKKTKILAALKLHDEDEDEDEDDDDMDKKKDKASADGKKVKLKDGDKSLREELDAAKVQLATIAREKLIAKLCREHKLPDYLLTDVFTEQLVEAADEKEIKKLIEDRRKVAGIQKPRTAGAGGSGTKLTQEQFERQLKAGAR